MDIPTILSILPLLVAVASLIFAYLQWKNSKQKDNQIKIINNYFPDIKINELPKNQKEIEEKINQKFGFIREDLLEKEIYIDSPIARYKIIIERLNKYLDKEDINILIASSAVCRVDDEEKYPLAKQLHFSLVDVYGKRGKRIYNMLKANVFDENILPYLKELEKFFPEDILRISKMLQEYFDGLIEHGFIDRLWVSGKDDYSSVLLRIKMRFSKEDRLNVLNIYVRKEYNISFTRLACKEFLRRNPDKFILGEIDQGIIRGEKAFLFKINRKTPSK